MIYLYLQKDFKDYTGIISNKELKTIKAKNADLSLKLPSSTIFKLNLKHNGVYPIITFEFEFNEKTYSVLRERTEYPEFIDIIKEGNGVDKDLKLNCNEFLFIDDTFKSVKNNYELYQELASKEVRELSAINKVKIIPKSKLVPFTVYEDADGDLKFFLFEGVIGNTGDKKLIFLETKMEELPKLNYWHIYNKIDEGQYTLTDTSNLVIKKERFLKNFNPTKNDVRAFMFRYNRHLVSKYTLSFIDYIIPETNMKFSEFAKSVNEKYNIKLYRDTSVETNVEIYQDFLDKKDVITSILEGELSVKGVLDACTDSLTLVYAYIHFSDILNKDKFLWDKVKADFQHPKNRITIPCYYMNSMVDIDYGEIREILNELNL